MAKLPIRPKNPERICWGCDKYCTADTSAAGMEQFARFTRSNSLAKIGLTGNSILRTLILHQTKLAGFQNRRETSVQDEAPGGEESRRVLRRAGQSVTLRLPSNTKLDNF